MRLAPSSLLAVSSLGLLVACGAAWFDAGVLAGPVLLPAWLRGRRERRLRLQLVVIAVASIAAAALLIDQQATLLGAPTPWPGVLLAGYYLFALVVVFRMSAATLSTALARRAPRLVVHLANAAFAVLLCLPLLFCVLQSHRVPLPMALDTALPNRELNLTTADGLTLRATLLPQPRPSPGVVVCHGLGANRAAFLAHAELAWRLGCQVLLFDFRAHGESPGHVTTFGADERRDVDAAITALLADANTRGSSVVLLGVSMGAATALLAAHDPRVAGVLAESSFSDLRAMAAGRVAWAPAWVQSSVACLLSAAAHVVPGIDFGDVAPVAALAALPAERPVQLVHAGDDAVVPREHGERLARVRGQALEVFEGAAHAGCLPADPVRYRDLLRQLLARAWP